MSIASMKAALARARAKKKPARPALRKNPIESKRKFSVIRKIIPVFKGLLRPKETGKRVVYQVVDQTGTESWESSKRENADLYAAALNYDLKQKGRPAEILIAEFLSDSGIHGRQSNPLKKWIVFLIDDQFPDTEKGKADALAFAQRFADKHKVALGVYKA